MKKVRIMLLAIAIIAIAAGTLAFKASYSVDLCTGAATRNAENVFTCKLPGMPPQICNVPYLGRKSTMNHILSPVCTVFYTTTEEGGDPTCINSSDCGLTRITIE